MSHKNQIEKNEKFFPKNHIPAIPLRKPVKEKPIYCNNEKTIAFAAKQLANSVGSIAIDTERASGYTYFQKAYLIQIQKDNIGSFLIDPIGNEKYLLPLINSLKNREWVIHAADQDLPSLFELGFQCKKLFDTELAGRILNFPRVNLSFMVDILLGLKLEKGFGQENWSTRPLPEKWLNYAALDVEVLLELKDELFKYLKNEMKLEIFFQECEYKRLNPLVNDSVEKWKKIKGIGAIKDEKSRLMIYGLWKERENLAKNKDIAPHLILKDSKILSIAKIATTKITFNEFNNKITKNQLINLSENNWEKTIKYYFNMPAKDYPNLDFKIENKIPISSKWSKQKPEAWKRLNKVRLILSKLSEKTNIPSENILLPSTARILAWNVIDSEFELNNILESAKVREWQKKLLFNPLKRALIPA